MATQNIVNNFPFTATTVTTDTYQAVPNSFYVVINADPSHSTLFTLPVLASVGSVLIFVSVTGTNITDLLTIEQNAGQYLLTASGTTTTPGIGHGCTISYIGDIITLYCLIENTVWGVGSQNINPY